MRQMLADVLLDPGIAALITLWTAATVRTGHPASGSRKACSASTNALTTTGALTPVAARTMVPVAPFTAVAFGRAHGAWSRTARIGAVRTLPTAELPFAAKLPFSWGPRLPAHFMPECVSVVILTILPADALASVVLAVALIAILSDALITELSLGAIAVASKLALPFAAGPTAIVSSVLNPGASAARSPLVIM